MYSEKVPKNVILAAIVVTACCFAPIILLAFASGTLVSFLSKNKLGVIIFGLLLVLFAVYVFYKRWFRSDA